MNTILIIEDDDAQRSALQEFLEMQGKGKLYDVYAAAEGGIAMTVLRDRSVDLVLSDLMLPDMTGVDILKSAREAGIMTPFLIMTGQPSIETAVDAIRSGASDYILKPVDLNHLKVKIEHLIENVQLKKENRQLRARISESMGTGKMVGGSPEFRSVVEKSKQIASADVTVLIEGESGTGKEIIANFIHENSSRSEYPFIKVNCGALTKTILESELFGTTKGAYTGADRDRPGYFEAASGGSIFLDEIGEMDLESQVRLLRVLEEREVVRLGSTKPIKVDVRVISATNRSLLKEVEEGKFREDLYYRLAVIRMELPPLRRRVEDIPLLFNHFVVEFNEKYHKSVTGMSPELKSFMENYDWPGNIRQFRNTLEAMVVLAREDILTKEDLPHDLSRAPRKQGDQLIDSIIPGVPLKDYEKAIIEKNLRYTGGNREKAAGILGIAERTMYRKINEYDLRE